MKKNIKSEMKPMARPVACCSRRQKVWGVIALVGLFVCGWMVGAAVNNWHGRAVADVSATPETTDMETCELIESLLLQQLAPESEPYIAAHEGNIEIYTRLFNVGCAENRDKYTTLIARERAIVNALAGEAVVRADNARTCIKIENELGARLYGSNEYMDVNKHIDNAKIYANLSERGCPENSDKYVALAKQELELARALEDDNFDGRETIEVVETYKRINMQAAAQEIFDKVKKLTDPAIDFIIQVEKIINE